MTDSAKRLHDLKQRALNASKIVMVDLKIRHYMPLIEAHCVKVGTPLSEKQKLKIRQVMNINVSLDDEPLLKLIEKALAKHKPKDPRTKSTRP